MMNKAFNCSWKTKSMRVEAETADEARKIAAAAFRLRVDFCRIAVVETIEGDTVTAKIKRMAEALAAYEAEKAAKAAPAIVAQPVEAAPAIATPSTETLLIVPATPAELRELRAATIDRVNAADTAFEKIVAELWSVPTLSERAEQLRAERSIALDTVRHYRAALAEISGQLRQLERV